jgi:hypothetical protein
MAEAQVTKLTNSEKAPSIGLCLLNGRISNRRKQNTQDGTFWLTVLKLPAKDSFSHPGTVEVISHEPIGAIGDDWRGQVEITGYPRTFNTKPDPETGEIKRVSTADNRLRVVEA